MKILFLNPIAKMGGAELSLLDLIQSLKACPVEISLIVFSEGPLVERAKQFGVHTHVLPLPRAVAKLGDSGLKRGSFYAKTFAILSLLTALPALFSFIKKLRKLILELRPTVLHTNGMKCHLLAAMAHTKSIPIVWHIRDFLSHRIWISRLLGSFQSRVVGCIANSDAVRRDLEKLLKHPATQTIYNAIDLNNFRPENRAQDWLPNLAGLATPPSGTINLGLVATYARWKGHDLLIEASRELARKSSVPFRVYIVGGPIYQTEASQFNKEELLKLVESYQIGEHFGFIPFQENTAPIYQSLDVVVHASTRPEPFGRTIVEAMACGKPVLVANSGGASEIFEHGISAWGYEAGCSNSLATAMKKLIEDGELRERLGKEACLVANKNFSRARLGNQLLETYRRWGIPMGLDSESLPQNAAQS